MKRNKKLYCTYLLLCCLALSTTARSQVQKIYLHPKAAGSEKQSQVVDSIRFIPLEAREDIRVGGYNNLTVTANYFLVIDYPDKAVLFYSKKGAFVKKISYKGLGENFYPAYHAHTNQLVFFGDNKNYALTPKDRIKIMLDWSNPRNKKYFKKYTIDLNDAGLAIKKDSPNENDIQRAYPFYDDYYWSGQIMTSPLFKDSLGHELSIYQNKQLVQRYFPYNRVSEPRFLFKEASTSVNKTELPDTYVVTRPFCDTIYKLVKDSLFPAFHLVLPLENSLPASFFSQPFKNKTERENFERNNGWMLRQVHNFYETPRFIFFTVGYLSNYEGYLYQKQTNSTYKTKNIRPDSSQYNLPLLGDFNTTRDGNRFYKTQKAGDLLAFFAQHKSVPVPKELENFFNSKPHSTAPVVVEFKLKD